MKKKVLHFSYLIFIFTILSLMFVFTFFGSNSSAYEDQSSVPSLLNNGQLNTNISQDVEDYMSKNFGFRQELLQLHAEISMNIFDASPITQVVKGEDGFLYYEDTVNDYLGLTEFNEREKFQIKHTLELIDEYVKSQGKEFLFLMAPNKNSLYDFMPASYIKLNQNQESYELLKELNENIYLDLFQLFNKQQDILYYKTDSHWNNQGALLVYNSVLDKLSKEHDNFSSYKQETEYMKGDLYNKIFPKKGKNEETIIYDKEKRYTYLTKTRNHEQPYIETFNEKADGSLLMFRDSFANNLIDYFSDAYKYAIYDKSSSYNLDQINTYNADTVIIELAQRNVSMLQENKPVFPSLKRFISLDEIIEANVAYDINISSDDKYHIFSGNLNEKYLSDNSLIYLKADNDIYEMTPQNINDNYGFFGCIEKQNYNELYIIVVSENQKYIDKVK